MPSWGEGIGPHVGPVIKDRREHLRLSQRQVAQRVGVSPNTLSMLERGETRHPSGDILRRVADVLDVRIDDLLKRAGVESSGVEMSDLQQLYDSLDGRARRAMLEVGRIFQWLQSDEGWEPLDVEPRAAREGGYRQYKRPDAGDGDTDT